MAKEEYNFSNHPNFNTRHHDLDPNQKGLLKITAAYKKKKEAGDRFEKQISDMMQSAFNGNGDILLNNVYFETGNFVSEIHLYESLQLDHILISKEGIFCIEDKWLDDNKYVRISGNALAKTWTVKSKNGKNNKETNGLKQNFFHKDYLEKLLSYNKMPVPVFQITVVGGISREKINVQQFIDANLVDCNELIDRIKYIKKRNAGNDIDVGKVRELLEQWTCKDPAVEKQHIVYVRHITDLKLPKRCKKLLR